MEQKNPVAFKLYLLNALKKFEEKDQIQKMRRAQENLAEQSKPKGKQFKRGSTMFHQQMNKTFTTLNSPGSLKEGMAAKRELFGLDELILQNKEIGMKQDKEEIEDILDKNKKTRFSLNEAKKMLIRRQFTKLRK
mmetsp:Transcript_5411/g.9095  ORF Transcript_5411/g.9095 Transcript_5411/m.9095 type:complete len:135 (-) Transcript_5411:40-444(-)